MKRLLKAAAALLCVFGLPFAQAQLSTITASSIDMGGVPIAAGTVTFTPVNSSGIPIAFATGGGGLNSPTAFSCTITAGAITGSCQIPDAALTTPANILYSVQITNTATQKSFTLQQVANITGTTWPLDQYGPPATTNNVQPVQVAYGTAAPPASCVSPSFYVRNFSGGQLWVCVSGTFVQITGSGGSSYTFNNGLSNTSGTVSPTYGTAANTVAQGNDSRFGANAAAAAAAQATANAAVPSIAGTAVGTLYGFGDSTMRGVYAYTPLNSTFSILARDFRGSAVNDAVSGALESGIAVQVFEGLPPVLTTTGLPVIMLQGGINDANSLGVSTGSVNNYNLELDAAMYWADLLPANKIMASAATASGFSATYTGPHPILVPSGAAKQSITVGDTLTFSGTAVGNKVGLTWAALKTGTGTFTISLNGTLQTDVCSGTTTFSGFGCNSQAVNDDTFFRQEFSVTPGAAYTLAVTVTGTTGATNIVAIVDADTIPTSSTGLPVVAMNGVIRQLADASSTATAAFNTAAATVTAQAATDHLNVTFVDVRNGTPGVNTTTDMAASTSACPAITNSAPLHPNACGYLDWAQTIENAMTGTFAPGTNMPAFQGPVTSNTVGQSGGAPSITYGAWNNNLGAIQPTSAAWAPVFCSFPTNTGFYFCSGLNWSATQSGTTNALLSTGTSAIQHCSGTTPGSCTDSAYWDTSGNQHNIGNIQAGPTTAPTCSSATAGTFQYTQGNSTTKDVVQVCAHDASNVYAWRAIY